MSRHDPVLSSREVAEQLGVHYETALGYMHSGEIKAVKRGRRYFTLQSAVDAFLDPASDGAGAKGSAA